MRDVGHTVWAISKIILGTLPLRLLARLSAK